MSCEAVKEFLSNVDHQEKIKEAKLRYEILRHYNLGQVVIYEGDGDMEDYPLTKQDEELGFIRFKYVCDISDEDFEKIKAVYYKETEESKPAQKTEKSDDSSFTDLELNKGAEKTLNTWAGIYLFIGIVGFVILFYLSFKSVGSYYGRFNWGALIYAIVILVTTSLGYAFARVLVNISKKLNKLK